MSRNIVPRANKDADLGTPEKNWNKLYADAVVLKGSDLKTTLDDKVSRNILTAKGDLFVATNPGIITRLPKGEDGHVLTTNSTKPEGLEWRIGDVRQPLTENLEVTVGSGGDFNTINQAIGSITSLYTPRYLSGGTVPHVTIRLLSGFVMSEQVLVKSIDLSWITIVGDDEETVINRSALIKAFANIEYPAFGAEDGGFLPNIGQLFNMDTSGNDIHVYGIYLYNNSSVNVLPNCGIKNAANFGIYAKRSHINAVGAIFSGASHSGIATHYASIANVSNIDVSGANNYGIWASSSSLVEANGAIATNIGNHGIYAEQGTIINARDAVASVLSESSGYGFRVGWGGIIVAWSATGTLSQAKNTLTYDGIIFQY